MKKCILVPGPAAVYTVTESEHPVIGVIGREHNQVDYTKDFTSIRMQEKDLLGQYTGLPGSQVIFLNQVHGNVIEKIAALPEEDLPYVADADGMITDLTTLCLVIRTADCVPLFAVDRRKKCIGAVHSGWRSTEKQIAALMVRAMVREYHSNPADLHVYMLPAIGAQSYQVNMDVATRFPGFYTVSDGGIYLDLYAAIASSLEQEGVLPARISVAEYCTLQHNNLFFSHRAGDAGRNLNFIYTYHN